jgi:peptide/nickel transport system permease protein
MQRSRWLRFALRRLTALAAVLATLVVGTFFILQLIPGDPARIVAGPEADGAQIAVVRHQLGLDQPLWHQFTTYIGHLLQGNLGTSYAYQGQPVTSLISQRLPFTAELALLGLLLTLLVAVPLGMTVAVACRGGRRRMLDVAFSSVTSLGGAVPVYVMATFLVVVFALKLKMFPPGGAATPSALVLPVLAVSIAPICALSRIVRRETAVVLGQDYMRTARGKRLATVRLYTRHALPNLMTSTLTVGGIILVSLLGGTVLIESVFDFPGLGTSIVAGILRRDYPMVQGLVLTMGMLAALINMLIDLALALLDPRRLSEGQART